MRLSLGPLACELELCLPAKLRLAAALGFLQPRDLVLDGREQALTLRELRLDRLLLGREVCDDVRLLLPRFRELLLGMSYADPAVRPLLDLEGLKQWRAGRTEGYALLNEAVDRFGSVEPFVRQVAASCA